jgi:hypothetical protein
MPIKNNKFLLKILNKFLIEKRLILHILIYYEYKI